jgi:uncharacterized membrane protein YbhN (UPF0104 family)
MTADGEPAPHIGARRAALGVGLAILVGVVLVTGIGSLAGFDELRRTLREGDHGWLALCALAQIPAFGGYAVAYRGAVCFEGGPRIPLRLSLRVVLATFGLTQVGATAGALGLAAMYWTFRRLRFDGRDAAVRTIGLSTLVYLVFGLVGLAAALPALSTGAAPLPMAVGWLMAMPVILLAAAWFTAPARVVRFAAPGGNLARQGFAVGVSAAWWVRRALRAEEGRALLAGAGGYWLGIGVSLWAALHAFGSAVPPAAVLLAFATGYAAQIVPIPLSATGGVDAATTFALHAVGVPLDVALVSVLAHRIFSFWLPLVPSLACIALLPRTGRLLAQATREPAAAS